MTRPRPALSRSSIRATTIGSTLESRLPRRWKALSLAIAAGLGVSLATFGGISAANAASTTMTLDCTSTAGGVIDISTDYGPAPDGGYPSLSVSVNYGPNEQSAVPNADGIYTAQVSYDNATFSHIVVGFTDDPNRYLAYQDFEAGACDPEPTPTPTPTQTTTPSPTPTPTETVTPTPEPTPSPTFSPSPTASPTDTPSPTPSATPISVPSPSSTPSTPVLAVTGIDPVASSVGGGVGALLLAAGIAVVLFVRRRRNA